MSMVAKNQEHW